jgi:CAF1 family ribonuclease
VRPLVCLSVLGAAACRMPRLKKLQHEPAELTVHPGCCCQASSLQFLAEQGFDFNKMINDGIPSLPAAVRDRKLDRLASRRSQPRGQIALDKPEDARFAADLVRCATLWLEVWPRLRRCLSVYAAVCLAMPLSVCLSTPLSVLL